MTAALCGKASHVVVGSFILHQCSGREPTIGPGTMATTAHEPSRRRVITLIILGTLVWAVGPVLVLVEQRRERPVAAVETAPAEIVPTAAEPDPMPAAPTELVPAAPPNAEAEGALVPASTTVAPPADSSAPISG
jgi:hypothetical protein